MIISAESLTLTADSGEYREILGASPTPDNSAIQSFTPGIASVSSECAHCGNYAALKCSGCKDIPREENDSGHITLYCNIDCQKSDWPSHRRICKHLQAKKLLYRAGDMLQKAWLAYREGSYDRNVIKVDKIGEALFVYHGNEDVPDGTQFPFPNHLMDDPRDKQAVLCHLTCFESLAYMYNVTKDMLQGTCALEEVHIRRMKSSTTRQIVKVDSLGGKKLGAHEHVMIRATLKNGKVYALDFTGAQFGIYEPIMLWDDYARKYIAVLGEAHAFGHAKASFARIVQEKTRGVGDIMFYNSVTPAFERGLQQWLKYNNTTLRDFMKLPEEQFCMQNRLMWDNLRHCFHEYISLSSKSITKISINQSAEVTDVDVLDCADLGTLLLQPGVDFEGTEEGMSAMFRRMSTG